MTTGTKIFLAVFAAFIGVLVLYYGVLMPEAQSLPAISAATRDVPHTQTQEPNQPSNGSFDAGTISNTPAQPPSVGILTETMQGPSTGMPVLPTDPLVSEGLQNSTAGHAGSTDTQPTADTRPGAVTPTVTPTVPTQNTNPAATGTSTPVANQPVSIIGEHPTTRPGTTTSAMTSSTKTTTDYVVKSGDTMSSIAEDWFGDASKWSMIAKENPVADPNRLSVGQKLRLPSKDAKPATVKEQAAPDTDQPHYTVRSGDTLSKIAREYYGDVAKWKAIYDANKSVIGSDPANLKAGMKIKLPPPSKPASR